MRDVGEVVRLAVELSSAPPELSVALVRRHAREGRPARITMAAVVSVAPARTLPLYGLRFEDGSTACVVGEASLSGIATDAG